MLARNICRDSQDLVVFTEPYILSHFRMPAAPGCFGFFRAAGQGLTHHQRAAKRGAHMCKQSYTGFRGVNGTCTKGRQKGTLLLLCTIVAMVTLAQNKPHLNKKEFRMKTTFVWAALSIALIMSAPALAQTPPAPDAASGKEKSTVTLENDIDKASYAVGIQLGEFLKRIGLTPNQELFMKAIDDVTAGREPALSQQDAEAAVRAFMTKAQKERGEKNLAAGEEFLKANAAKEGVKVLPSGLQYKVITEGDGPSPTANDKVKVHYTGTLIDGTKFDSSLDRGEPVEFGVTQVIKGWTEALQLMKKGAKWQLFIPPALGYGARDQQKIPANSVLIFDVELIDISQGDPNTVQLDSKPAAAPK